LISRRRQRALRSLHATKSLVVEIYPGFAAGEALFGADGEMVGVATGDMGVGRDGRPKSNFTRGK
jgi:electron-transferring-flavoprotein dehydrogenase